MIFKTFVVLSLGFLGVQAEKTNLRGEVADVEHLDLEVVVEGGERKLFPLLPGTKCPAGHVCHSRTSGPGVDRSNLFGVLSQKNSRKDDSKTPLTATLNWGEFDKNMDTLVQSDAYCDRRSAMAKAAGLAAGLSVATVNAPGFAAGSTTILMGDDTGLLVFVPKKASICKGDSVTWKNNKGGPHNVVFDEEEVPSGVDVESISMDEQLGEEGDTYKKTFDTAGTYGYYCEPHRGAGMTATLVVA